MQNTMGQGVQLTRARLTTPRAGAIAGVLFSLLFMTSLILIRISIPYDPTKATPLLVANRNAVGLALNLIPFSGIAFLWFIAVVRDRLGNREDRFFATVFLGSGLLFLAMLFVSAALAGGIISMYGAAPNALMDAGLYSYGRVVAYQIMNVYTLKMAGVFMISASTLSVRTGIVPRWMALLGYALALLLLFSLGYLEWGPLIFPLWVLLVSVYILVESFRTKTVETSEILRS